MKNHIHKLSTYIALILLSALPLSTDVFAESSKEQNPVSTLSALDEDRVTIKRKEFTENQ